MTSVDVVVPCYNYARFLPRCIKSLLDQEGVSVRVLVIDDASSDDTPLLGQQLQAANPRVEFRRHATNLGHIATYNEGLLGWASADYSVLISADDLLAPGALRRATELMNHDRQVAMTYGMCAIIDDTSDELPQAQKSDETQVIPGRTFAKHVFDVTNVVPTPTAVVRTELQQKLGGYRQHLPHSGDMEMWLRFAMHGSIGVIRATQAYYRRHTASMSARYYSRALSDRSERLAAYDEIVRNFGPRDPELNEWRANAARRLAAEALWFAGEALGRGDLPGYRDCRAFAVAACPAIRFSKGWASLHAKRVLGASISRALSVTRDRMKTGATAATPSTPSTQIGWWPS